MNDTRIVEAVERQEREDAVFADRAFYKPVVGGIRLGFGEGEQVSTRGTPLYLPDSTVVALRDLLSRYIDAKAAAAHQEKPSAAVKRAIARKKAH